MNPCIITGLSCLKQAMSLLEFASSGTDDVDIRFINIANPAGVKAEIETIFEQQTVR